MPTATIIEAPDSLQIDSQEPFDPIQAAEEIGLRYVSDTIPGIRREKSGDKFAYIDPHGKRIADEKTITRINKLAVPPAYTDVWICPFPSGHLQATGRDARNRKQYRYHLKWRAYRDGNKFHRMIEFAAALPAIRARVEHDLGLPGLPRPKILATIVRLLETTHIRIGNEEYARLNHSYGLTTLSNEHIEVTGTSVHFHFRGKSGKDWTIDVKDRRLARIVRKSSELPGQHLFEYTDHDGAAHTVNSSDVNDYIREIAGSEFTAKDFRTWAGTVLAGIALQQYECDCSPTELKRNVARAIEEVSRHLGNTPAICRKCYIHPAVLNAYLDGSMLERLHVSAVERPLDLLAEEVAVLALLTSDSNPEVY